MRNVDGFAPVIQIVAKMRPRSRPVRAFPGTDAPDGRPTINAMPLQIRTQPDPEHFCETCGGPSELISHTITRWDGNETMAREVSPWTPPGAHPWSRCQQTEAPKDAHVCGPLRRSVGTADRVPVTGRCRLLLNCAVSRGARWPGQPTSRTLPGVCNLTARPRE